MKKYTTYKPSGIEWIGEIPEHWDVSKYKYNLSILSGFPFKSELFDNEVGYPLMRIRDITSGTIETYYTGDFNPLYIVQKGDVIIGMDGEFNTRIWDNIDILLNQRCCKITDYKNILLKFIYYALPIDLKIINDLTYYTTVKHLSVDDIKNISCIIPPIHEQQQIVQFLDEKTEIIDKLISTKKNKIDLLKEQRKSLINQVITKGLVPHVKMKDSGVEWIGDIPSHWKITPLRYLGFFQNGISKSSEFFGTGYPFMNYGDVYKNDITPESVEGKIQSTETDRIQYSVIRGDVFFTRTSESKDDIGVSSTCLKTIPDCVFSGFVIRFRFYKEIHIPEYSRNHFQTYWKKVFIESKMDIVTRSSLSQQVLGQVPVLIPPMEEQQQIVEYLDKQTKEIDDLMTLEQKKIEVLKEYRQSLISEIITGKIDVRTNVN